jgi:hypothetical protein
LTATREEKKNVLTDEEKFMSKVLCAYIQEQEADSQYQLGNEISKRCCQIGRESLPEDLIKFLKLNTELDSRMMKSHIIICRKNLHDMTRHKRRKMKPPAKWYAIVH